MISGPTTQSEFCEGHVDCPTTGREACAKPVVWSSDGNDEIVEVVLCYGCYRTHDVANDYEMPGMPE